MESGENPQTLVNLVSIYSFALVFLHHFPGQLFGLGSVLPRELS